MTLDKSLGLSQCANSAAFCQIFYMLIYVGKFWRQPWKQEVDAVHLKHGEEAKRKKIKR